MTSSRPVQDTLQKILMTGDDPEEKKEPGTPGSFVFPARLCLPRLFYCGLIADCSNSSPIRCACRGLCSSRATTTTKGEACQLGGVPPINQVTGVSSSVASPT